MRREYVSMNGICVWYTAWMHAVWVAVWALHRALCDEYPLVLLSIDVIRCRFGTFTCFGFKSLFLFFANVIPSWGSHLFRELQLLPFYPSMRNIGAILQIVYPQSFYTIGKIIHSNSETNQAVPFSYLHHALDHPREPTSSTYYLPAHIRRLSLISVLTL